MDISIHSPHAGRDSQAWCKLAWFNFNPLSPCGERRSSSVLHACQISIHSPHAGRDWLPIVLHFNLLIFQSTLPMRGETGLWYKVLVGYISIHSPHAGRDRKPLCMEPAEERISIHSPHAGRDMTFQCLHRDLEISIHSPHAGRDATANDVPASTRYFNPLSPCGERPGSTQTSACDPANFNPLSPCGERLPQNVVTRRNWYDFNPLSPCGERQSCLRA